MRCAGGKSRGPEPVEIQPWASIDYGPSLMATYEVGGRDPPNIAYKGIAIRLDAAVSIGQEVRDQQPAGAERAAADVQEPVLLA